MSNKVRFIKSKENDKLQISMICPKCNSTTLFREDVDFYITEVLVISSNIDPNRKDTTRHEKMAILNDSRNLCMCSNEECQTQFEFQIQV